MTGPVLTVLLLALFGVGLITGGIYLIGGLGPALLALGIFSMIGAAITARGMFNV